MLTKTARLAIPKGRSTIPNRVRRVFPPIRNAETPKPAEPHSARGGEVHGCDG
jgi:hypothetical protein